MTGVSLLALILDHTIYYIPAISSEKYLKGIYSHASSLLNMQILDKLMSFLYLDSS